MMNQKYCFLEVSKVEFQGWDRFYHITYPLDFAFRATTQHLGNTGGLQILRCQGFEVKHYDFTLDALALKPSGVCNVGGKAKLLGSYSRN
jgi:hypothetical protein